jgi:hypothetical protein
MAHDKISASGEILGSRRYVVKAIDEYGSFEYAHFEDLRDAKDCADELHWSDLKSVIIDRREQIIIS